MRGGGHGGAVARTVTSRQEGSGFEPDSGLSEWSLQWLHGFSWSTLAFSHSPKTYKLDEMFTLNRQYV